jgi:uncharacterized membrane protein HdeD (DUF308 family)
MRTVAIAVAVIASAAWGFYAFALAAYEDIDGTDNASLIAADIALAAIGITCVLLAVRARSRERTGRIGVLLTGAGSALVAWLVVAASMAP